ncbi:MATE family efflux transporter [Paraconexibacter sp.]|uniref:MATE family efflux transporter n=1 Tax=Paraconexibacter sp. TaxID=2949640 RepID=UPI003564C355
MARSPYDREILALAFPALGALAAEPTYLLVDTAIVGHLGTRELAALALAASVLGTVTALCNFLAYGTTAQVARLHGAGEGARAGAVAAQALWLSLALGVIAASAVAAFAEPLVALLGGEGRTAELAARYLRLAALGLPAAMLALGGQGYLRGVSDLRTPLIVLIVANVANAVLEVVLVYGLDTGLDGSALGTVIAQAGMGAAFAILLLRAARPAGAIGPRLEILRPMVRTGGDIVVRTGALLTAFVLASAVTARIGEASLAAHQIAFQLFIFLALTLDALAIAGQVLVGRRLGAGDVGGAFAASRRMVTLAAMVGVGVGLLLLAGREVIPRAFSSDPEVLARAHDLWPLFAAMQPVAAVTFAFDGILLGAGDTRFLALAMVGALLTFAPLALLALAAGWGVIGVWAGLNVLMLARAAATGHRFRGRRWLVPGAVAKVA